MNRLFECFILLRQIHFQFSLDNCKTIERDDLSIDFLLLIKKRITGGRLFDYLALQSLIIEHQIGKYIRQLFEGFKLFTSMEDYSSRCSSERQIDQ